MQTYTLIAAITLFFSLSLAWPWPPTLHNLREALGQGSDLRPLDLLPRAPAAANTAAATTQKAKATGDKKAAATTAAGTTAAKATGKASGTASGTKKSTAVQSIPQDAPAGGFSMVTPAQTAPTYAKIGSPITFVWNYTSILVQPSAVDIVASNTDGVWTIASNMSAKQTSVVWDTGNEATPLPMESYTLVIYDSHAGATAVPSPGHLSPYIGYQFAMYKPQPYVSSGEYFCVTCNAGVRSGERQSLLVLFATAALATLGAVWFVGGGMI